MKRPSLAAAFGSKKDIYLLALQTFQADLRSVLKPALTRNVNLAAALNAFLDEAIDFYSKGGAKGCLTICTAAAAASTDKDIQQALLGSLLQIEGDLKIRIEEAGGRGMRVEPAAFAKLVAAVLTSIAVQARAGIDQQELRKFARSSLSVLLPA